MTLFVDHPGGEGVMVAPSSIRGIGLKGKETLVQCLVCVGNPVEFSFRGLLKK